MFNLGGAAAAFTSRKGGVSVAPFSYLNLAEHVGDNPHAVLENRRRLRAAIGCPVMWMNQVHSDRVHVARPGYTDKPPTADALIVPAERFSKLELAVPAAAVMVADCLPLLLASSDGRFVAAVHVGRAGLVAGIIERVLEEFNQLGVPSNDLHAALGPSICGKCYEVPLEMQRHVCGIRPAAWSQTRWQTPGLDIPAAVYSHLTGAGVTIAFRSKRCTFEDSSLFSYRRSGTTGRFVGIIVPLRNTPGAAAK